MNKSRIWIIARMDLIYNGKTYPYEDTFVVGTVPVSVRYIYEEGNYSCDCNRSLFIRWKYGNVVPELPCGDTIKMRNLVITHDSRPLKKRPKFWNRLKLELDNYFAILDHNGPGE